MTQQTGTVSSGSWRTWTTNNPYFLLAMASLFWSGNHIVGRAIGGQVPPVGISMLRWLIPAIVMWPFIRNQLARDWPEIRKHWVVLLWLGITGGALFSALQYVGLQYTTALNVSVLNSLVPVLILAVGTIVFGDRCTVVQGLGIATSLIGVLVIVARGDFETLRALRFNWGDLIILFNMLVFAIYAACLRLRPQIHWLSFLFVFAMISAVTTLPFAIWEWTSGTVFHATTLTIAAIVYVSIFPSVVAFAAWARGVELIGAIRAGPYVHLVPVYTA
ncbi:MAG: DMT family transporter, partial [Pseudolabrys sp.]|nr:DMT family transporter [Pseudolabrys sp.]